MEMTLRIPPEVWMALKLPDQDLESVLLLELSISLYERKILSFGKSRELSGFSKWQFHDELGKRKIERHYDMVAFEEDLEYGLNESR
jgi:predicted HTH domain antitoxin